MGLGGRKKVYLKFSRLKKTDPHLTLNDDVVRMDMEWQWLFSHVISADLSYDEVKLLY